MNLSESLRGEAPVFAAWSAIPDPLVAEILARSQFNAVTLDMQHGCHSTESVMRGVAAVTLVGKPAVVRVPVGRFDIASRALDFGAAAVIAPMVNSRSDAEAFAAAMKFPPLGERSWGPTRVLALQGGTEPQHYLRSANRDTLALAMVETRAAYHALDDILGVEGIDGIFVGPSDFSIALSGGGHVNAEDADMLATAGEVAERTRRAGKIPCTLAITGPAAHRSVDLGFRFVALGGDFGYLTAGANALVQAARR